MKSADAESMTAVETALFGTRRDLLVMEPSQILITVLLAGAAGSVLLTFLFFLVASTFMKCPECRARVSRKSSYCGKCGGAIDPERAPLTEKTQRPTVPASPTTTTHSLDGELSQTFQLVCQLSPENRARLTELMRQRFGDTHAPRG